MATIIETGKHQAVKVPGNLHARQIMRLGELMAALVDENGGYGCLHLEIRGGDIVRVSKETSELFAPDRLRPTA